MGNASAKKLRVDWPDGQAGLGQGLWYMHEFDGASGERTPVDETAVDGATKPTRSALRRRLEAISSGLTVTMFFALAILPTLPWLDTIFQRADGGAIAEQEELGLPAPPSDAPSSTRHAAGPRDDRAGDPPRAGEPPSRVASTTPAETPLGGEAPRGVEPSVVEGGPVTVPDDAKARSATSLFAAVSEPAQMTARAIGAYGKGCLAGGQRLTERGPAWQVMRPSRNRNWGHPALVQFIERFATEAKARDSWPGLLVGDLSQPRGGPMVYGHASHQLGLDVDIWYIPMPDRALSRDERDQIPLPTVLKDHGHVDPELWTPAHAQLLRRAAADPRVERIFVHPAIKKSMCETVGTDRALLSKLRPMWGHDDHFHVRLACPPGSSACQRQSPVPSDSGCGGEVEHWIKMAARAEPVVPVAGQPVKPPARRAHVSMDKLPTQCRAVVAAPSGPTTAQHAGE